MSSSSVETYQCTVFFKERKLKHCKNVTVQGSVEAASELSHTQI